jgi:hypothetical protein
MTLLFDRRQEANLIRLLAIENTAISMVAKRPSNQDYDDIKPCQTYPSTLLLDCSRQSSKESSSGCDDNACSPNFCRMITKPGEKTHMTTISG